MPSSTSASDSVSLPRLRYATWALALGCLLVALGLEAVARVGIDRGSRIQRRMMEEYRQAVALGQDGSAGRHVLVVGNSLLDEGIDFGLLEETLHDTTDADVRRYMVEQTVYYDWLYGVRRLFQEGARPDAVVVLLGTGHWLSPDIRGDYSAQYMMSPRDLPDVARELHMHPTKGTGLLFAGLSKFWGARSEIRTFVLRHAMPDLATFMNMSSAVDRRPMVDADITPALVGRVARMREETDRYGCRLIVVVPPLLNPQDGSAGLLEAARRAGVSALRPVPSGSLDASLYRDGFHLNEEGASIFTARLIPELQASISHLRAPRAN